MSHEHFWKPSQEVGFAECECGERKPEYAHPTTQSPDWNDECNVYLERIVKSAVDLHSDNTERAMNQLKSFISDLLVEERERIRKGVDSLGYVEHPVGKLVRGQDVFDVINDTLTHNI